MSRRFVIALTVVGVAAFLMSALSIREEERALAVMILAPHRGGDIVLSADLTLPRAPENHAWYSIWLMIVGSGKPQRFVQIGLARQEPDALRGVRGLPLSPFIAWNRRGEELTYRALPPLAHGGNVRVAVGRHADELFVSFDGKVVHRERATDILDEHEAPTFQLSSELFAYGDRAVGTIERIELRAGPRSAPVPVQALQFVDERGTCLMPTRDGYRAAGVFHQGWAHVERHRLPKSRTACPER